jgi:molecular chaperone GrpE
MVRRNGNTDLESSSLDAGHELPPAEADEGDPVNAESPAGVASAGGTVDVQKLRAERDSLVDRLARLQAEFENARRRMAQEQQNFRDYALTDAVKTLLPVLDSFERALQSSSSESSEFRGGVELIYKQLQDALGKIGLRPINAAGEQFDPHQHEAIEMVDTSEARDHEVLEELQRGYKLKERLIRPAMVRVARNSKH